MDYKTPIEKLKEHENDLNLKAGIRGFKLDITYNKNNTGSITIWKLNDNTKKFIETLNIEGVASFQIAIKKDNEILEHGLFLDNITKWIYNRLNNENIEFMYEFIGGKYNGKTMTRTEVENISNGRTEDLTHIRQQGAICHREELDNQPLVNGYLSPMFSHIDYGLIYLRYETQEVYNVLSN